MPFLAGLRALPISPTLLFLAAMLVWSLVRAARFGSPGAPETSRLLGQILGHRATLAFLVLAACANLSFSILAGYINPRDYVQDAVAARQFLRHASMYPSDLPQMGIVELSAPIRGRATLEQLPLIRDELNTLTDPPAPVNAHPPVLGVVLATPLYVLGFRGSFVFVVLLSCAVLYVSTVAILRELFPRLPLGTFCAVLGLVFAWYPVGAALRSGQPSVVLFGLLTAGWLLLRRNRPYLAGSAIGLAACLHAFPALLTLYFAIRSRRAFVASLGTILALNVAATRLTVEHTLRQWLDTASFVSQIFVPKVSNISIAGLASRLSAGIGWGQNVSLIVPVVLVLGAGALGFFLTPWNRRNVPLELMDIEYSVFVGAMLLASPISWSRYLPILLLPLAVLIWNWRQSRPAWAVPALLAALVFMTFSDSTINRTYAWLSAHPGFAIAWLVTAMPSFSVLAVVWWLGLKSEPSGSDGAMAQRHPIA